MSRGLAERESREIVLCIVCLGDARLPAIGPEERNIMLEEFVRNPATVRRLRSGALGSVLDVFVSDMRTRGHAARTIKDYVREAGQFAQWMTRQGRTVDTLSRSGLDEYLTGKCAAQGEGAPCKARHHASAALGRLLATLHAPPSARVLGHAVSDRTGRH
jgi:hypothetical protein